MDRRLPVVLLLALAGLVTACGGGSPEPRTGDAATPRPTPRQTGRPPTPTPVPTPPPPPTPTPTPTPEPVVTPSPVPVESRAPTLPTAVPVEPGVTDGTGGLEGSLPPGAGEPAGAGASAGPGGVDGAGATDGPGGSTAPGASGGPGASGSEGPAGPGASVVPGGSVVPGATPAGGEGMPGPGPIGAAEEACPDALARDFDCITLTVPLDHFAPGTATTDVVAAIHRHTIAGKGRGVLVMLVGGPGASGIASARELARTMATNVRARYDLVFLDRRGTGRSDGLDCPDATKTWLATDVALADAAADDALVAAARTFADACVKETGTDPATLRFLSTAQAAEDLEALRRYLGADTMTIYGAAEGSLLAQAYADAHPAQVWRLILDAPLDPGMADLDRLAEAARASDQVLTATLAECATAAPCTRDVVGKDALAAFDGLMSALVQEPRTVELTNGSGGTTTRTVGAADLALVAQTWLGTERDRMLLQRAIAAASQGRWWHLVRMLDLVRQGRLGPGAAPEQAGATEAARLAIACADADLGPGSDEDRASAWLAAARVTEATDTRLARMLAADLPCAFWPGRPAAGGAAEGDADGAGLVVEPAFPVLLLGATLDPSAPWANGERMRLARGRGSRADARHRGWAAHHLRPDPRLPGHRDDGARERHGARGGRHLHRRRGRRVRADRPRDPRPGRGHEDRAARRRPRDRQPAGPRGLGRREPAARRLPVRGDRGVRQGRRPDRAEPGPLRVHEGRAGDRHGHARGVRGGAGADARLG
ncbi:MAG: alpha/beta fold hydrolase [Chloroflexota bacterium]